MGVKREPKDYNWEKLEFDESLLLPRNFNKRSGRIQFFAIHHMIILNREVSGVSANQRCYNTWIKEGRQASANYGVDGDFVNQFVYDGNAAWANANYWANHNCLSIEHANATLDLPGTANDYVIDERTFFNGARLVAHGHLLYGLTPKRNVTVRRHSEFTSTACPGPYMNRNWNRYFDTMHDIYSTVKAGRNIETPSEPVRSEPQPAKVPLPQVAQEVLSGVWGNGKDRVDRLVKAGYDANAVQRLVNQLVAGGAANAKASIDAVAREVLQGRWGNGTDRRIRLQRAKFDPDVVQRRVNELLRG